MNEPEVGSGIISWVDPEKQFGIIIQDGDNRDIYFEFKDVEIGRPQEGVMVHFIRKPEKAYGIVAKNISVLSNPNMKSAARRK